MKSRETNIAAVKLLIIEAITKRYGSMVEFLKTDFAKSLGPETNIKAYLYPSGAVSFPVLSKMCEHLGIGKLNKEVKVVRKITYTFTETRRGNTNK